MEPVINLMVARVVQFSDTHYDKSGMFLEFLVDELRPVIVEGNVVIDIFSHQIFDRVPMIDGIIPLDTLSRLSREELFAYTVHSATFPDQYLPIFLEKALETYRWYHEQYLNSGESSPASNVISFEKAKKKLLEKKRYKKKKKKKE